MLVVVQDLEYAPLLSMIIQLHVENFASLARFRDWISLVACLGQSYSISCALPDSSWSTLLAVVSLYMAMRTCNGIVLPPPTIVISTLTDCLIATI
jgi:hypothetical protein